MEITAQHVRERFDYDMDSGKLLWRHPSNRARHVRPGDEAGRLHYSGYRIVKLDGRQFAAHRLIWLYVTGQWPSSQIDHRNGVRADNRWQNLREATNKQNSENRRPRAGCLSAFRGVSRSGGKWCAVITHFGRQKVLGRFESIDQAKLARVAAERALFTHSERSQWPA